MALVHSPDAVAPTIGSPSRLVHTMNEQTDRPPHIGAAFSRSSGSQTSRSNEQALSLPRTQDAHATYASSQSQPTTTMTSSAASRAAEINLQAQAANRLRTHYWQTLTPLVNARTGEPIHGFPLNAFQVRYLSEERLRAIEWELGVRLWAVDGVDIVRKRESEVKKMDRALRRMQDGLLDALGFGGSRTYL